VNPDPQYGGYGMAKIGDKDVAGIGGVQTPDGPAWLVYIGTKDAEATNKKVAAAGGKVVTSMDVPGQGHMSVFQDPSGAFIAAWQPHNMGGAQLMNAPNTFSWAELNARGIDKAKPFYEKVFGWDPKNSEMNTDDAPPYTEFHLAGESIAGGMEMNPMVPAEVPSYWMVYFGAEDVDKTYKDALDAGATEMLSPQDFPGGRFAIVQDPQGAAFGLLKMKDQS
jgi:uncharacterized protein